MKKFFNFFLFAAFQVTFVYNYAEDYGQRAAYLEGRVGEHVIFNCHIDFPQDTPIPYVLHWLKDGKMIFSWDDGVFNAAENFVGRILLLDKHKGHPHLGRASINLTSIRENDSGWYQCKVYFPNRTPSSLNNGSWFHLAVDGDALLKIPPINQTVMEGDPAMFRCIVKNPDTMHVEWFKDGIPIVELSDLTFRTTVHRDGMVISPTVMSDLGEYKCHVRSNSGDQSVSAFLNVQYKAKVIYSPSEVYFPYGRPGILDCHFRSNPPLTNLRWEKDGFLFDPYNVQGVFYKRNGSLFFNNITEEHAGRYTCTPYNSLGTQGSSKIIHVIVQSPPTFSVRPKQIYITKLGEEVELHCAATDPANEHFQPHVEWIRKDGYPLPRGRYDLNEGNLTIRDIKEQDRGIYSCTTRNQAASISVDSEIMIENVSPMAPYNLTANSSSTAITLRWVPGYIRSYLSYHVWFRSVIAQEWRATKADTDTEKTIYNLEPSHEYEFMVLSQDRYGDGLFSRAFKYATKPLSYSEPVDAFQNSQMASFSQIGPPQNLTLEINEDGEYILSWERPEYGFETLRYYILRWWKEPENILYGEVKTPDYQYTVLENLREDEVYRFQVFSLSTTDYLAGSNEVTILVPPYNRVRATTIGSAVGVVVILASIVAVILYMRRSFTRFK
ncbi:protein borderless [Culicoides brevitarsis]|uniref:protein borderless n=1 Tax=Culicoides brevitarsis TaxID=469753 RepID=UPI00307B5801